MPLVRFLPLVLGVVLAAALTVGVGMAVAPLVPGGLAVGLTSLALAAALAVRVLLRP